MKHQHQHRPEREEAARDSGFGMPQLEARGQALDSDRAPLWNRLVLNFESLR